MSEPAGLIDVSTDPGAEGGEDFESFFHREHGGLFGSLWLITHDRHEAEEVMQEALVRVWERWDRVAGMDDPTGYLYRTAMNVLHSRVRRARTALRRSFRREPSTDALAAVEDRDSMSRRLARLTPRQRAVVVLVDLLEFTSEEAAQALGIRASTVRVLASRAHATLREEPNDG